ncbi:MAG: hypothetical protein Q8Q28_05685 [Pseudomonadota bacterium]|nr:hypothetical protein [Pseudomonadota bacterium]
MSDKSKNLLGVAFSGGGIRSATFNLGVLQGLAKVRLLRKVDQLSVVSGGGYIGAWFMALVIRKGGVEAVETLLAGNNEAAEVGWLRRHSNFLTPRTGLSGDTGAFIAIFLRNMLLNLGLMTAFLTLLLLLPHGLLWGLRQDVLAPPSLPWPTLNLWLGGSLIGFAHWHALRRQWFPDDADAMDQSMRQISLWVLAPFLLGGLFLMMALREGQAGWGSHVGVAAAIYLLPWLGLMARYYGNNKSPSLDHAVWALLSTALTTLISWGALQTCEKVHVYLAEAIAFGPPLLFLALLLPVGLHIGLAGRSYCEMQREWWSRLAGYVIFLAGGWALFFSLAYYGPVLIQYLGQWAWAGGAGWVASTLWGVLAGKASDTGCVDATGPKALALKIVPWAFIAGLLGLLAWFLLVAMHHGWLPPVPDTLTAARSSADQVLMSVDLLALGMALVGLGSVTLLLGWRLDINLFSLHNFYRNRLVRCYLGASRGEEGPATATASTSPQTNDPCSTVGKEGPRKANSFTGMDEDDDIPMSCLRDLRPVLTVNTCLNLVAGKELAWQERKAANFTISPELSGFRLPPDSDKCLAQTKEFLSHEQPGGIRLGTAITMSGAAVNPNMGYHSSPAVSFLLALFNARLGRWCGNPSNPEAWKRSSPRFGLRYLLLELFGKTDHCSDWVNLSDGGHFENLGLYELVRQRLPFIIASDAAEDAGYAFGDLADALRKIRVDLNTEIDLDVSALRPEKGRQRAYATVGRIHYPDDTTGVLLYLRPGLDGSEPPDLTSYSQTSAPFPFQSTVDQFFDEAQFESYRKLGQHIAHSVFGETPVDSVQSLFAALLEKWRGRLVLDSTLNAAHHAHLDALFERLRKDPLLAHLSPELFPEWNGLMQAPEEAPAATLPAWEKDEGKRKAGFYLCREAAQLMERVHTDLNLDANHDHVDCRGWMNLFRHWAWSPSFRVTYAITASTLGERFQRFARRHLQLDLGQVAVIELSQPQQLNFLELAIADKLALTGSHLHQITLSVPEPGKKEDALITLPVGFAILRGDELRYLRIQNHLRRLGLARAAVAVLLGQHRQLQLGDATGACDQCYDDLTARAAFTLSVRARLG